MSESLVVRLNTDGLVCLYFFFSDLQTFLGSVPSYVARCRKIGSSVFSLMLLLSLYYVVGSIGLSCHIDSILYRPSCA